MNSLQTELATYESLRDDLLRQSEGKFVLIHDTTVLGVFEDRISAVEAGYEKLGNVPFLTKQILREEPVVIHATAFRV